MNSELYEKITQAIEDTWDWAIEITDEKYGTIWNINQTWQPPEEAPHIIQERQIFFQETLHQLNEITLQKFKNGKE